MKSLSNHLRVLIGLLIILGVGSIIYEAKVLEIPLTESRSSELWTIDVKLTYEASQTAGVTAHFYHPDSFKNYEIYSESLVAGKEYGKVVEHDDFGNNLSHYSIRRAQGRETLYYHLSLAPKMGINEVPFAFDERVGRSYREKMELKEDEKVAADALIDIIRRRSSDTKTFISEAISLLNQVDNDRVKILLKGNEAPSRRATVLEVLLSQAHIPIERVNLLQLNEGENQPLEIWIRSYITQGGSKEREGQWFYFDVMSGAIGLPQNSIIWSIGNEPIFATTNAKNATYEFTVDDKPLTAISLAQSMMVKHGEANSSFLANSLYSLPTKLHHDYEVMIMIPFGVLVVLLIRNIIGFFTLGTFTPVLIALAFRETGLSYGIVLFTVIVAMGLTLRSYLEHLRLQMLSRLSVVLTFVVVLIGLLSIMSYKMGLESGLAITLFPMVILTMTIERLSVTWEERGGMESFIVGLGTLFSASLAFLLMGYRPLVYFVFTFPGVLFLLVAFMLAMGRYRGYRLTELWRFKAMTEPMPRQITTKSEPNSSKNRPGKEMPSMNKEG